MNQLEQKIREKCIEANPSILDLVMGCKVEYKVTAKGKLRVGILASNEYDSQYPDGSVESMFQVLPEDYDINQQVFIRKYWISKIIGRDITLADILMAIDKRGIIDEKLYFIGTSIRENHACWYYDEKDEQGNWKDTLIGCAEMYSWDLTKNFTNQSQEVKEFIGKLLNIE